MASTIRASLVHQRRRSDPAMNSSSSSSSSPSDGLARRRSILRHYVRYAFLSFIMLMSSLSFLSYHDKYFSRQTYERLSPTQHPVKSEVPDVKTKTKKKKLKKKRILGQPPTIASRWPTSHDLTDFVTGPAAPYYTNHNNGSQLVFPTMAHNQSVCEFRDISYSFHFPHAMQQLLRCFSWWHANRHQRPVLVLPATHAQYSYTSAFLQALRDIWKVQVLLLPKDDKAERPLRAISATVQTNNGKTPFQMTSLHDAQVLRDGIQQYYHLLDRNNNNTLPTAIKTITTNNNNNNNNNNHQSTTTMAPPGCPTPNQDNKSMPVVGFLNRQGGRRVTNYQAILQALNLTTVYYLDSFDHTTFLQQAAFMSHVDILIGPHGAQLTSAFLQPTCGGVLELFPKGLFWTSFFGTLATTTGHHHAALYTGTLAKQQNETKYYQSTLELRVQSRNFPIHANPPAVVQQVEQLIQQWRACCDSMYVDVEEEEVEEE
ncbi:expressed unknown protein [Seminavis robusta]|uniref:Glycosyltransferase 61 catalytic domain-containing protein n=1 Tax=Seminavis robusta TaxID=568900 RepID=A0A9N8ENN7_9STRA|nr:expressed unknown protein [Seminavis robusta]|eukprot:Sro1402_g269610.1 n/a (486) ;mRNA; r:28480-29937